MSKPLALMLTDTHLELSNIELVKDIFSQAINQAAELGLDKIYHLGDIFNSRKSQHFQVLKAWNDILDNFSTNNIILVAIPGNHDKLDYTSYDSYLDIYTDHPAFELHHDVDEEDVCEGMRLHFVPYFDEKETYPKKLREVNLLKGGRNYLLTHIAFSGVRNNDGSVVENQLTDTEEFDKVFVGHYHDKSRIGSNIYYIGSSYQRNHGEDDLKGFTVLYQDGSHDLIISEFPRFIKVVVDVNVITSKQISSLKDEYVDSIDNIRFEFVGDKEAVAKIDKSEFETLGISVKKKFIDVSVDISEETAESFGGFDKENIVEEFEEFCYTSSNISDDQRDVIYNEGLERYLQKALSDVVKE